MGLLSVSNYPPIVLFLDDEKYILKSIEREMRGIPVSAVFFSEPQPAFEYIENNPVAVIVTDYQMPGMKGPEFLERAKLQRPDMAGLLLTGQAGLDGVADAVNRGAISRYIEKPWNEKELLFAIKHHAASVLANRFQESLVGLMERLLGYDSIPGAIADAEEHFRKHTGIRLKHSLESGLTCTQVKIPEPNSDLLNESACFEIPDGYRELFESKSPRESLERSFAVALRFLALITHSIALNDQLRDIARTDGLSGIRNRRAFDDALKQECERASRYGSSLALLLCDIDKFKSINDDFGHAEGDRVIRGVGGILGKTTRAMDVPGRYGGDEFAVIMPGLDGSHAIAAAERIRCAVGELEATLGGRYNVRMSIGVAEWGAGMAGVGEILSRADSALYTAKEQGRDRAVLFAEC